MWVILLLFCYCIDSCKIEQLNSQYGFNLHLIRLNSDFGLIIGSKWKGDTNIDVGRWFSSILYALVTPSIQNPKINGYFTCQYQNFVDNKILFTAVSLRDTPAIRILYSETPSEDFFCSCTFIAIGTLK